jgi:hypothetical protein
MKVTVERFQLEGCQCRLKFDPKELQELLYQKITEKVGKNEKHFNQVDSEFVISGAFTEIDEGNFALHLMLAFIGKASLTCRVKVTRNGQNIFDEPFRASATCACFTGGKSQLKCDVNVIADQLIKKTIKALKTLNK